MEFSVGEVVIAIEALVDADLLPDYLANVLSTHRREIKKIGNALLAVKAAKEELDIPNLNQGFTNVQDKTTQIIKGNLELFA